MRLVGTVLYIYFSICCAQMMLFMLNLAELFIQFMSRDVMGTTRQVCTISSSSFMQTGARKTHLPFYMPFPEAV